MNSTEPSLNGDHPPVKKKRVRKKKEPFKEGAIRIQPVPQGGDEPQARGRLGSEIECRTVQWLLKPWFPMGMLSLIAGQPGVGKSTFVSFLVAHAGRAAILPGFEEDVGLSTINRMKANGVNLKLTRFLDDKSYTFPRDKTRVASILRGWEASLLVIDPIDSYMDEDLSENDGKDVRTFLESICWIAQESGAAVVGVRHPGKDKTNIMPGSRSWRAVPRSIALLLNAGGTPPRYLIRHDKDSQGQDSPPREYLLLGERGQPRKFQLKGDVEASLDEFCLAAKDPTGRRRLMDACKMIKSMFDKEEKPFVSDLISRCRAEGISDGARYDAMQNLEIDTAPVEFGGKLVMFRLQKDWPAWLIDALKNSPGGLPR